jgi:transglutaminase/protease-like cytokinesis protein 3
MRKEAQTKAEEIADKLLKQGMSDYDKIYAVNEYLCDNVEYSKVQPYSPVTHSAYGALVDGIAVCDGYSSAAKAILDLMGVKCDFVCGDCINGGGHAWNMVNVDGEWYHLDVTWNDGSRRSDYFLVTDDYMRKSRSWDAWDYHEYETTPSKKYGG